MSAAANFTPFAVGPVSALCFTTDGTQLAALCDHKSVYFSNPTVPATSAPVSVTALPYCLSASSLTALAYPHPSALYTADARGALNRYDASVSDSSSPVQTFSIPAAHSGVDLTAVAALSAKSSVLTAAKDGAIRVWDPNTRQSIAKLTGHRYDVRDLAVAESHDVDAVTVVVSAGRDRTVRLWDVRVGGVSAALHLFEGHTGWVHSVAIADGSAPAIVSCSGDKTVRVWDLRTMRQRVVYNGHQYRIWSVTVAADAAFAASGSTDATVRIWPIAEDTTEEPVVLEAHRDSVLAVAARRDGSLLLSACEDGSVLSWRGVNRLGGAAEDTLIDFNETQKTNTTPATKDTVPKQMDTTPLIAEPVNVDPESTADENRDRIFTTQDDTTFSATQPIVPMTANRPEQDPLFDKSAAELVGALRRIQDLEHELRESEKRALEGERVIATLKEEITRRDNQIAKLQQQVDVSKRLTDAAEVHKMLAKHERKTDVEIDYREPVNKIGAVSDELSKLVARLDAMIATN